MIVSVSRSAPRERFELICPPTHALFFLFGYRFPKFFFSFTISVDISSQFPVGGFMTLCLTYPSLSVSLPIRLFFRWVAVITAHCLVFRGPSAAARLQTDALYAFVASSLLPHTGHGPFCLEAVLHCVPC